MATVVTRLSCARRNKCCTSGRVSPKNVVYATVRRRMPLKQDAGGSGLVTAHKLSAKVPLHCRLREKKGCEKGRGGRTFNDPDSTGRPPTAARSILKRKDVVELVQPTPAEGNVQRYGRLLVPAFWIGSDFGESLRRTRI